MSGYDIAPERVRAALGLDTPAPDPVADDAPRLAAILGRPVTAGDLRYPSHATLAAVASVATDWDTRLMLARMILVCGPDALLIPDANRLPLITHGDGRRVRMDVADGLTEVRAALAAAPPGALGIAALLVCVRHEEASRRSLSQGWPDSTVTEWREQAERSGRWLSRADAEALGALDALAEWERRAGGAL